MNRIELKPEQRQYILWLDGKISAAKREAELHQESLQAFVMTLIQGAGVSEGNWKLTPDGAALILEDKTE